MVDPSLLHALSRAAVSNVGQAALAEALGITRQAVHKWKRVPERFLADVAKLTKVPMHDLRPDLYQPAPEDPRDVVAAFEAGCTARANGIRLACNPYRLAQPKAAWAAGWESVRKNP